MSICPWDSILGKVLKDAGCILETASSSARSLMICLSLGVQPGKVCDVRPHAELTRAKDQGEEIWHEEEWQYRTHL